MCARRVRAPNDGVVRTGTEREGRGNEPSRMVRRAAAVSVGTDIASLLPASTPNGRARAETMRRLRIDDYQPTSVVEFHSHGRILIFGPAARAMPAARRLSTQLACIVLLEPGDTVAPPGGEVAGVTVARGHLDEVGGYLGNYRAVVSADGQKFNLAQLFGDDCEVLDLVLDLGDVPHIQRELPPLGYFAPAGDPARLDHALAALPDLSGEFEKPKFFNYDPSICAHGRSGLPGCSRCIDACPTLAIRSLGDVIEVNPFLCQGAGSCATACPTGAIRYAYPAASDLLNVMRSSLQQYRELGGARAVILLHDSETGAHEFSRLVDRLPETVLPFEVEEIGSAGMETWLSCLAYGAEKVVIFATESAPASVLREISLQLSYVGALLEGMGYSRSRVQIVCSGATSPENMIGGARPDDDANLVAGTFAGLDEKRTTLRLAMDHLHAHAPQPRAVAALPAGAPFGEVWLDSERCTLCMACVSQCPVGALLAGDGTPQLRFLEQNCVQCGLCARTCPEDAIGPSPRYLFDSERRSRMRVLHQEEPFRCVACGKPFATQKIMDRMTQKLRGHWMFQDEQSLRRLQMCEDCRVVDLFRDGPPEVNRKPEA